MIETLRNDEKPFLYRSDQDEAILGLLSLDAYIDKQVCNDVKQVSELYGLGQHFGKPTNGLGKPNPVRDQDQIFFIANFRQS